MQQYIFPFVSVPDGNCLGNHRGRNKVSQTHETRILAHPRTFNQIQHSGVALLTGFLLSLHFSLEGGGCIFLRNVGLLLMSHTVLHSRRYDCSTGHFQLIYPYIHHRQTVHIFCSNIFGVYIRK
jgi:hypothetical protein